MRESNVLKAVAKAVKWIEKNGDVVSTSNYAIGLTEEWKDSNFLVGMGIWPEDFSALLNLIFEIRLMGKWPFYSVGLATQWIKTVDSGVFEGKDIKKNIIAYTSWERQPELVAMMIRLSNDPSWAEAEDKVGLMRKGYELGYQYEQDYKGCAQCTIAAVLRVLDREEPVLFRAANGLAAGMALYCDGACGGYSGGILSLGLFAGRRIESFDGDRVEKDRCYALTKRLHDRFIQTYGTVICSEIHKEILGRPFCLRVDADKPIFEEAGAHSRDKCPAVVGTAASWVLEILYEEGFVK
ncbi:hypothetical protein SANA_30070 [Gottschalkiaceae bacterium SANA]|nr:hypothetical protein SANA_30070 [Gottschalkiaceae bacterium SANA]